MVCIWLHRRNEKGLSALAALSGNVKHLDTTAADSVHKERRYTAPLEALQAQYPPVKLKRSNKSITAF